MTAWLRRPVLGPVAAGAALRVIAAFSGYGPFAADDYHHGIEMAWHWLSDPGLPFNSEIRSPLFPRLLWIIMAGVRGLGLSDPARVLQACYLVLGLWSLLVIPGVYHLTRRRLGDEAARRAAWLTAVFAIMPRISTRALLGVAAMAPLVWGLVLVDRADEDRWSHRALYAGAGGLLLGVAALLRFQVGIVAVAATGVVAAWVVRDNVMAARRALAAIVMAGIVVAGLQWGIDATEGRPFFGTLLAYFDHNVKVSNRYGVSAWYTYGLQLLLMTGAPVTWALARPMWRALRSHAVVAVPLVTFVVVHSVIPHKEDRFMFPILPLLFVVLGAALAEAGRGGRWSRATVRFFWAANALALAVATFSDGGRSHAEPNLTIARAAPRARVAAAGHGKFLYYYLGEDADVRHYRRTEDFYRALAADPWRPDYILFRKREEVRWGPLDAAGLRCGPLREFPGDWVDQIMVALNPEHTKRRRATWMTECGSGD